VQKCFQTVAFAPWQKTPHTHDGLKVAPSSTNRSFHQGWSSGRLLQNSVSLQFKSYITSKTETYAFLAHCHHYPPSPSFMTHLLPPAVGTFSPSGIVAALQPEHTCRPNALTKNKNSSDAQHTHTHTHTAAANRCILPPAGIVSAATSTFRGLVLPHESVSWFWITHAWVQANTRTVGTEGGRGVQKR
jgi:hypothetical protein